jgi:hypothetical protein
MLVDLGPVHALGKVVIVISRARTSRGPVKSVLRAHLGVFEVGHLTQPIGLQVAGDVEVTVHPNCVMVRNC